MLGQAAQGAGGVSLGAIQTPTGVSHLSSDPALRGVGLDDLQRFLPPPAIVSQPHLTDSDGKNGTENKAENINNVA